MNTVKSFKHEMTTVCMAIKLEDRTWRIEFYATRILRYS